MPRSTPRLIKRLLFVLLLLAVAVYLLLPSLISFSLQEWLRDQDYTEVSLADVDFEPFAGELRLQGLQARHRDGARLALQDSYLNLNWWALPRHRAQLRGVALEGLVLSIVRDADGQLVISGLPVPAPAPAEGDSGEPWGFGIDRMSISDSELQLRLPGFERDFRIEQLLVTGVRSWDAGRQAELELTLQMDGTRVAVTGEGRPFAEEPAGQAHIRVDGLDIARLATDLQPHLPANQQLHAGALHLDIQLDGQLSAGQLDLNKRGTLRLQDLAMSYDGEPQGIARLSWDGRLSWSPERGLELDGELQAGDTRLNHQGRQLLVDSLAWTGRFGWSAAAGPSAAGQLRATGLEATQPAQQLRLARIKALQLPGLRLSEGLRLDLDGATIDELELLHATATEDSKPLLRAATVMLGASQFAAGDHLTLGELAIAGADLNLVLAADGRLQPLGLLDGDTEPGAQQVEDAARPGPRLSLAGVRFDGPGRLAFADLGVQPPFRQAMDISQLRIGAMDSAAAGSWTPIALAGAIGEYSRISVEGQARPFADKVNVELTGTVQALDLPPLSSYTARALGYNLQSGQLESDIDLKISDDQLDGAAKLVLNKLTVKAADAERMAQLSRELSMPLDSALNMLRDGDDNIRLKLPVAGDIHKPDFDIGDIINKAMGKALQTAALSYVKYALQPYGALISLAQIAGKAANRVALQPVTFEPGSAELGGDSEPYLGKLTTLLAERPALRIQICGLATEADRLALQQAALATQPAAKDGKPAQPPAIADETLLQLAESRAAAIKRQLVVRGAAPERLFVCNPEIDKAADAEPRAQLML